MSEKTTQASQSALRTNYYSAYPIKKNGTSGECSMYGGEERCLQGFGMET